MNTQSIVYNGKILLPFWVGFSRDCTTLYSRILLGLDVQNTSSWIGDHCTLRLLIITQFKVFDFWMGPQSENLQKKTYQYLWLLLEQLKSFKSFKICSMCKLLDNSERNAVHRNKYVQLQTIWTSIFLIAT